MLAVNSAPYEINDQEQRLREQLRSDHTYVPQESAMPLPVVLVDVDTGEPVSHLATIMIRNDLEVMALVSSLHERVEPLGLVKGIAHLRDQLAVVVLAEVDELTSVELQRLQLELDLLRLLGRIGLRLQHLRRLLARLQSLPRH